MKKYRLLLFAYLLCMTIGASAYDFSAKRYATVDWATLSQVTKENADTVVWFTNPITVMNEKASASYKANAWIGGKSSNTYTQIYTGHKLTITAPESLQIDSLEFTYPNTYSYGAWENSTNWTNVASRSLSADRKVATIRTKVGDLPLIAIPNGNAKATQIKVFYSDFKGIHTPRFTPDPGSFYDPQDVTITAEEGMKIHCVVDGGTPFIYSAPIKVSANNTVIRAYAEDAHGNTSEENTATYTIHPHYTSLAELVAEGKGPSIATPLSVDVDAEITKIADFSGWNDWYVEVKCGEKNVVLYKNGSKPEGWEVGCTVSGNVKGEWKSSQYGDYSLFLTATGWSDLIARAYDFSAVNSDGKTIYYNITSSTDLTCEITYGGTSYLSALYSGVVNIPASVTNGKDGKTYSVTSIGSLSFYNCKGLTSITIPNSVTSVDYNAFNGCSNVKELIYAEGTKTVLCTGLTSITSVTIPNSVTSIGTEAFYNCNQLKSVEIPNSVTNIGNWAFSGCNLYSLTIGSGVLSIGNNAFPSVVKTIWMTNTPPTGYENVKSNVNYVSNNLYTKFTNTKVYQNLSSLFTVDGIKYAIVSPSSRTCDVIDCMYDSTSVEVNIGETVVYKSVTLNVVNINDYACYGDTCIEKANISNNGYIGESAFYNCIGLQTLNISNNDYLGYNAFYGTTALNSAVISNKGYVGVSAFENSGVIVATLTNEGNVESGAFYNCKSLITLYATNNGYIGGSAFCNTTSLDSAYIANKGYVGASAFENSGVKVAKVHNNGGIYDCAFKNSQNLVDVSLGDSITTLGNSVFYSCTSLPKVVIPNNITSMGESVFRNCKDLNSVEIGTCIPEIKTYAFSGCSSLPEIEIPQNVKSIGNNTFSGCTSLADVIFADRATTLTLGSNGSNPMFKDCPLDSVYIGGKLKYNTEDSYGYSPFYRNTSLRTVVITNEEETVYDNEFYGCAGLKSVSIGNGTRSIGNWAFSGCSNLEYFAFGQKIATIGKEAFSDCVGVTKIISHAIVPPVCGEQALDDINKWECELIVPKGHGQDYTQAEQWKEFFFISESGEEEPVYVTSVTIDESEYQCVIGQTGYATATIKPDDATNKTVVWSSSDEDKLTIDANTGEFIGLALGNVTIKATATDGSGVFGQAIVVVQEPSGIEEISLSPALHTRDGVTYNLQGVRVDDQELRVKSQGFRGIVIKNGKKYVVK